MEIQILTRRELKAQRRLGESHKNLGESNRNNKENIASRISRFD